MFKTLYSSKTILIQKMELDSVAKDYELTANVTVNTIIKSEILMETR